MTDVRRIDAAFKSGDLGALKSALDDPDSVPNGRMPPGIGSCLTYAIYHSPLSFVRTLLEMGADPSPGHDDGFPPLIAALWQSSRTDTNEVVRLLLSFGADPDQRGHNDYSPLHVAVIEDNLEAVQILLDAGADPNVRTRIDHVETPWEMAKEKGAEAMMNLLRKGVEDD